jgi:hypothetical protein
LITDGLSRKRIRGGLHHHTSWGEWGPWEEGEAAGQKMSGESETEITVGEVLACHAALAVLWGGTFEALAVVGPWRDQESRSSND